MTFDVFEVTLALQAKEVRVFDVFDGTAEPTVLSLDELRQRLGGGSRAVVGTGDNSLLG